MKDKRESLWWLDYLIPVLIILIIGAVVGSQVGSCSKYGFWNTVNPKAAKAKTEQEQEKLLREQVKQLKRIADALEEKKK